MLRRSTSTRTALAVLAAGLGLALVAAVAPASAAPASSERVRRPGRHRRAEGSWPVRCCCGRQPRSRWTSRRCRRRILPKTNVDLARSQANLESNADVDTAKAGVQRTSAIAGTTGSTSLLGAPVSVQKNTASAPASEAHQNVLIPLDLSPLLNLPVIRTSALANWISDTQCVAADTPLSQADQTAADLTLLGIAPNQSVAELNTANKHRRRRHQGRHLPGLHPRRQRPPRRAGPGPHAGLQRERAQRPRPPARPRRSSSRPCRPRTTSSAPAACPAAPPSPAPTLPSRSTSPASRPSRSTRPTRPRTPRSPTWC